MYQSASAESNLRFKALENWTEEKDTYVHDSFDNEGDRIEYGVFPYTHSRDLDKEAAKRAFEYIKIIVARYPFQLRYAMALPLWERYCQEWCESGDEARAMRAI